MADSTGPVLGAAGLVMANDVLVHGKVPSIRIAVGAGIAAVMLAVLERASHDVAVGLAWSALIAVIFVRIDANTPTPAESVLAFYNGK